MSTPTRPPACRCAGTGAYTTEIPVADAVVLVQHLCVDHVARRTLVKERGDRARTGELMDVIRTGRGMRAYVRPRGGGREWVVDLDALEPAESAEVSA